MQNFDYVSQFIIDLPLKKLQTLCDGFAILKIAVDPQNDDLLNVYQNAAFTHNTTMLSDLFPNSGFDIYTPSECVFTKPFQSVFIDHKIKTEMLYYSISKKTLENTAYLVHPRSSISKLPLMLANHTGIIDQGYRGNVIGAFRWLGANNVNDNNEYVVEKNTRLLQICHPSLCRVFIVLVSEPELSNTIRGEGGFGSTGK
jgi:dUTPase